ncbi:hypothetical protein IFJ82_09910 [Novacetimonas hansenii]|uniref:hypothetical protein n=1 Tax=Novacetimonas hansenii TaxID=436 RepID=UPI0017837698|nr:hypothetical protein [Novacetimonas hansenii]QOF94266.1 hypothetical protein IFJ82_09910 [Novacetimonas hansenii]
MTTTTNWPNPNRPGAPMFPDREGWHVMEGICGGQTALTHWNGREWGGGEQVRSLNTSPERYRYVGAVYTPAQVSALLAAERERCAIVCDGIEDEEWKKWKKHADMMAQGASNGAMDCASAIRNLGDAS